jgi:alpha-L-rhamnosidase
MGTHVHLLWFQVSCTKSASTDTRYIEVTGAQVGLEDFTAIVIASDMRPTGTFTSSHSLINQLHKNVIWGMLGNFVSVPTDCPQRDERLGWTGDLQVFAPTANFLFDTSGFLSGWLRDLSAEVFQYGIVPEVIPFIALRDNLPPRPHAIWADVAIITPHDLYKAFGDEDILEKQYASMQQWLDKGLPRQENGLWQQSGIQYGDWLDPKASPAYPAHGTTDPFLAANAYLVHVTRVIAGIAKITGRKTDATQYQTDYGRLLKAFRHEYVSPSGRLVSDTQTALALALHFDLLETQEQKVKAAERLDWLIKWDSFKVSTGFAGTPIILDTLAENGKLDIAYRMLQERDNPSWLYPVSMGATTIVSKPLMHELT